MTEIGSIHTFEDRPFLSRCNRRAVAVFAATLVLAVAAAAVARAVLPDLLDPELRGALGAPDGAARPPLWSWPVLVLIALSFAVVLHELVHAALFKLLAPSARVSFGANWRIGMVYACAEGIVYRRRSYELIALSPSLAISFALVAFGALGGHPLAALVAGGTHLSCCSGDWGYVHAIRRDPRITHCEDTPWGVRFFHDDRLSS